MSEPITPEIFNHLVELAALELTPAEADYLRKQLNNQLTAIDDLNQVPLDPQTPVASRGVSYTPAISALLRADECHPHPDPAKLLKGAPETDQGYLVVPEIPHQDL